VSDLVAVVYNDLADPRGSSGREGDPPAHVVRSEIPVIEDVLRKGGREVLTMPVGEAFLDTARELGLRSPSVVINLCEDLLGDSAHEMHFTALLELLGLPYTGSPPLALGLCRDKGRTKSLLRQYGIPTPDWRVAGASDFPLGGLEFPLIVKPAAEDGSLGIDDECVTGDESSLRSKVAELLGYYDEVLVEEYVAGRELNAAILGTRPLQVLPVSEIDFSGLPEGVPAICGYEAKWEEGDLHYRGTVPRCPADLESSERGKLESLSASIFHILGLRDYARIDWRLSPERGLQFLEANPNPDISPSSGFLRSLRAAGLDYREFIDFLLSSAASRKRGGGLSDDPPAGGTRHD
jgi:D-alanine-D-alanine ligase